MPVEGELHNHLGREGFGSLRRNIGPVQPLSDSSKSSRGKQGFTVCHVGFYHLSLATDLNSKPHITLNEIDLRNCRVVRLFNVDQEFGRYRAAQGVNS